MLLSIVAVCIRVIIFAYKGRNAGLGVRTIQILTIVFIIPAIIILSLQDKPVITGETIAVILGTMIGYILSKVSNYDANKAGGEDD